MAVLEALIEGRVREAVRILSDEAPVRAAYVFGSHVEGTADAFIDIDIAAFVEGLEEWDLRRRACSAARVQKEAGDDLDLHFFPADALIEPPRASFVTYILEHGLPVDN